MEEGFIFLSPLLGPFWCEIALFRKIWLGVGFGFLSWWKLRFLIVFLKKIRLFLVEGECILSIFLLFFCTIVWFKIKNVGGRVVGFMGRGWENLLLMILNLQEIWVELLEEGCICWMGLAFRFKIACFWGIGLLGIVLLEEGLCLMELLIVIFRMFCLNLIRRVWKGEVFLWMAVWNAVFFRWI